MKKEIFHFIVQLEEVTKDQSPNVGCPSQKALTWHPNRFILLIVTLMPV